MGTPGKVRAWVPGWGLHPARSLSFSLSLSLCVRACVCVCVNCLFQPRPRFPGSDCGSESVQRGHFFLIPHVGWRLPWRKSFGKGFFLTCVVVIKFPVQPQNQRSYLCRVGTRRTEGETAMRSLCPQRGGSGQWGFGVCVLASAAPTPSRHLVQFADGKMRLRRAC